MVVPASADLQRKRNTTTQLNSTQATNNRETFPNKQQCNRAHNTVVSSRFQLTMRWLMYLFHFPFQLEIGISNWKLEFPIGNWNFQFPMPNKQHNNTTTTQREWYKYQVPSTKFQVQYCWFFVASSLSWKDRTAKAITAITAWQSRCPSSVVRRPLETRTHILRAVRRRRRRRVVNSSSVFVLLGVLYKTCCVTNTICIGSASASASNLEYNANGKLATCHLPLAITKAENSPSLYLDVAVAVALVAVRSCRKSKGLWLVFRSSCHFCDPVLDLGAKNEKEQSHVLQERTSGNTDTEHWHFFSSFSTEKETQVQYS
jgi:hypothetical protein